MTIAALQKNEFLHKLLIKLDQRQHYYISSILSVSFLAFSLNMLVCIMTSDYLNMGDDSTAHNKTYNSLNILKMGPLRISKGN